MEDAKHFIDNRWVAPSVNETIPVVDPSDGQIFAQIARGTTADIDSAVAAASAAERGHIFARSAMLIATCHEEIAQLEARDTGKPLKQARAEATGIARYFEFYAGAADKLHGETLPYQTGFTVMTIREPHGVTDHIACFGIIRCRFSSGASSARRWRRAMHALSRRKRACRKAR